MYLTVLKHFLRVIELLLSLLCTNFGIDNFTQLNKRIKDEWTNDLDYLH